VTAVRLPIDGGKEPVKRLLPIMKVLNPARLPTVDGTDPAKEFVLRIIDVKEVKDPIEFGILPVRLLVPRDIDKITLEPHVIPVQVHRDPVEGQFHPVTLAVPTLVAAIKSQRKFDSKVE
jgi:hypothetical protein